MIYDIDLVIQFEIVTYYDYAYDVSNRNDNYIYKFKHTKHKLNNMFITNNDRLLIIEGNNLSINQHLFLEKAKEIKENQKFIIIRIFKKEWLYQTMIFKYENKNSLKKAKQWTDNFLQKEIKKCYFE